MAKKNQITSSSTAEYFSKNLQQVGFSSQIKAVLTTLKESVDNSLDACEEQGILPDISIEIEKIGPGHAKNTDKIRVKVEDNGPGIEAEDLTKVFGEYLASSKFGRGRCSRGQQGIGISAATTWAQMTNGTGVSVISKTASQRKAIKCVVEVDIKNNKGVIKNKDSIDWNRPHGVSVEFIIDGRIQLNGEGGLLSYLNGTALVNPHLTLRYKVPDQEEVVLERVTQTIPEIPPAVEPHPHTMKLGEFIAHSHLFGKTKTAAWLKKGFSRVTDNTVSEFKKAGIKPAVFEKNVDALTEEDFRQLYSAIQNTELSSPSTRSVLAIGEEGLSKAIQRMGNVDFFSVVTRKPSICDAKPVQVEVAIARLQERAGYDPEGQVTVLRFANRVPLQFDKSACAIVNAIETVNWRAYELNQPKNSLPIGPYVIAVSVVSPFIKFKNASKETIDASDELVEEIRRTLIQAGQRLSRHIRKEVRANDLEEKLQHIEQFGPILVSGLCRISEAGDVRKKRAEDGLRKILGRDAKSAEEALTEAHEDLAEAKKKNKVVEVEQPQEAQESNEDNEKPKKEAAGKKDVKKKIATKAEKSKKAEKNKKSSEQLELIKD